MTRSTLHLLVSGVVQGVGYRAWTQRTARALGLSGWVRNLADGRVEIWAEGPTAELETLAAHCSEGPVSARVSEVKRTPGSVVSAALGDDEFVVRPTAADPV